MSALPKITSCKVAGVILAAGTASRMGKIKQLLSFRETTLLGQVIGNATRSWLLEVIVVLGHEADKIKKTVELENARLVMNKAYKQGQSTSLQAGLSAVSANVNGVMFIQGDQPLVGHDVMNILIHEYCKSRAPIVWPTYRNKRGNPVVIDRMLFPQIESLTGDVGARALFQEYTKKIQEIEVKDDSIHFDLDTREDYQKLIERERASGKNKHNSMVIARKHQATEVKKARGM